MLTNEAALSTTLSALSDPTRRAILARLANGPHTVNELAEPFRISLPAISRHLKVLTNAGLITRSADAQFRPCALDPKPLKQVAQYLDHYRKLWESRLDRLEVYLATLQQEERRHAPRRTNRKLRRRR